MTNISWKLLEDLIKDGILEKKNTAILVLTEASNLNEAQKNSLKVYNHCYDLIDSFEQWKMLADLTRRHLSSSFDHNTSGNIVKQNIAKNYLLSFLNKDMKYDLFSDFFSKPGKIYGYNHYISGIIKNGDIIEMASYHIEDLEVISEPKDLNLLSTLILNNQIIYGVDEIYQKIPEKIRDDYFLNLAMHKDTVWQLQWLIKYVKIDSYEIWKSIFKDKNIHSYSFAGSFFDEDFFEDIFMSNKKWLSNPKSYIFYEKLCKYLDGMAKVNKPIDSDVFPALKEARFFMGVKPTVSLIKKLKKNDSVADSEEFDDYIKFLIEEETRAGILREVASILPKNKLPWLLASQHKSVQKYVKLKLKA